jgi:hypothetical protein
MSASLLSGGHYVAIAPSRKGQQATFTDVSRVFELSVWNRDANHALPGHGRSLEDYPWIFC